MGFATGAKEGEMNMQERRINRWLSIFIIVFAAVLVIPNKVTHSQTVSNQHCNLPFVMGGQGRVPMGIMANVEVPDWRSLKSSTYLDQVLEAGAQEALSYCRREHPTNPVEGMSLYISAANNRSRQLIEAKRPGLEGSWDINRRGLDSLFSEMKTMSQQQLCQAIRDIRRKHAEVMATIKKESNPLKQQEAAQNRGPVLAEAQRELSFGEFTEFKGKVSGLESLGGSNIGGSSRCPRLINM